MIIITVTIMISITAKMVRRTTMIVTMKPH